MKFICYILPFLMLPQYASAVEYLKAELLTNDGRITKVSRVRADGYVFGHYKGKGIKVSFQKLKKVENMKEGFLRLTNIENRVFIVEDAYMKTPSKCSGRCAYINYYYYNEISMSEEKQRIDTDFKSYNNKFEKIAFIGKVGRLKYNKSSGKFFPENYIYDPYTGEQLEWYTPVDVPHSMLP